MRRLFIRTESPLKIVNNMTLPTQSHKFLQGPFVLMGTTSPITGRVATELTRFRTGLSKFSVHPIMQGSFRYLRFPVPTLLTFVLAHFYSLTLSGFRRNHIFVPLNKRTILGSRSRTLVRAISTHPTRKGFEIGSTLLANFNHSYKYNIL